MSRFPRGEALLADSRRVTPGGVHSTSRHIEDRAMFTRSRGAYLYDMDGHAYIDYHSAFGPYILGHVYPEVVERVTAALTEDDLSGVGTNPREVRLSQKICEHFPSAERVLLCNSGSEATYHALRVARAVTGRQKVIKFQGCYHGWHDSVLRNMLSTPDKIGKLDPGSVGMMPEALHGTIVCTFNDLDSVEAAIQANPDQIAALIIEPIPHNVGCLLPEQGFLEGLRRLTSENGIVLIFDEVITGFRHHLGGYQAICGVTPDLTTMGKAMANGFPIAALAGKAWVMEHFNTFEGGNVYFAGTYNGHVVGTEAALATLEIMEREPVHQHIFRLGEKIRQGLTEITERLGIPAVVSGFGSIFVTYFMEGPIKDYTDLTRNDAAFMVEYRRRLMEKGVFKLPMNLKRNHISYSHTDDDIDRTLEAAESVLRNMRKR